MLALVFINIAGQSDFSVEGWRLDKTPIREESIPRIPEGKTCGKPEQPVCLQSQACKILRARTSSMQFAESKCCRDT
jgi:hypothetical protein